MKKLFIVANWKSNKTTKEIQEWTKEAKFPTCYSETEVIVCPSTIHISYLKNEKEKNNLSFKIGAQDISSAEEGAHTGEVNGKQLREFVDYVIVGHSERRKKGETTIAISHKIKRALENHLIPILCVSNIEEIHKDKLPVRNSLIIVAYEPLFAIGSGKTDTPENANKTAADIQKELGNIPVLYGGSVTSKNIKDFTSMENINGVLVGGSSLNPQEFSKIVEYA